MSLAVRRAEAPEVRTIKALLLDDNDFDRQRIRRFSEKSGLPMVIEDVRSIDAMADKISTGSYDVILIDYHLADGSGFDALRQIKESATNRGAAVIMISGNEQTEIAVAAFRNGCQDYLVKDDLGPEMLQDRILTALNRIELGMRQYLGEFLSSRIDEAVQNSLNGAAVQRSIQESVSSAMTSFATGAEFETRKGIAELLAEPDEADHFDFVGFRTS